MWLKTIENVNDNYWYGDVEYYNGAEAMDIAGLTEEELKSSLPGLKPENIFVTKLDPEKIIYISALNNDGFDELKSKIKEMFSLGNVLVYIPDYRKCSYTMVPK